MWVDYNIKTRLIYEVILRRETESTKCICPDFLPLSKSKMITHCTGKTIYPDSRHIYPDSRHVYPDSRRVRIQTVEIFSQQSIYKIAFQYK